MKRIGVILVVLVAVLLMQVGCQSQETCPAVRKSGCQKAKAPVVEEVHTEYITEEVESEEIVIE